MVSNMGDKVFTLAEIKAAFWKTLDNRGDVFFDKSEVAIAGGDKPTIAFVWEDMEEALTGAASDEAPPPTPVTITCTCKMHFDPSGYGRGVVTNPECEAHGLPEHRHPLCAKERA